METLEIICGLHLQEKTEAHINMLAALTSHSALQNSLQFYDPFTVALQETRFLNIAIDLNLK